jgi:thiol-disulfide isomerase/thioredoxin
MKNHLFLYALLIITVLLMVGCTPRIPQLPIDNLQGDEADQENNQDESTGVPRVVFIELFNTDGCAASKVINPIIEEIVAEYENTEVILVEEAGWGIYSTEETSERFKWYFSDKPELHTPSVFFDGLNQLFAEGFSLGGGGNSGNSESGDTEDNGDPETGEVDTTKPVIKGSRDPLPNSFGWNNTDVTVSFSCTDTGAVQSGIAINTVVGKIVTTEGKDQSVTNTGVCTDVAGNAADPVTVSNINIDKTPPVVTITLPGTGEYVLNQSITATWSATDALSGVVAPVSGTVSIDTSSVGTKTFTLPAGTAKDQAGNSSLEVTISYSVIENTEEPVMWSGLGMVLVQTADSNEQYDSWLDTLMANGFTEFREIPNYDSADWLAGSKAAIIRNVGKGAKYIWGVASGVTITSTNWPTFRQAILDAATWAQANGVFEFQLGNEEEIKVDGTTITAAQLIVNLKAVATDVQAIFTNGNVSYTCVFTYIDDWITAGKGNIDILASNLYKEIDGNPYDWETDITNMVNAFGGDGTYLTEFSLSNVSLDDYSTDEAVQAAAITEMVDCIKASGMTRAIYFLWYHPTFKMGVVKDDGTYRLLWNSLLGSGQLGGDYMRLTLQEVTGKE